MPYKSNPTWKEESCCDRSWLGANLSTKMGSLVSKSRDKNNKNDKNDPIYQNKRAVSNAWRALGLQLPDELATLIVEFGNVVWVAVWTQDIKHEQVAHFEQSIQFSRSDLQITRFIEVQVWRLFEFDRVYVPCRPSEEYEQQSKAIMENLGHELFDSYCVTNGLTSWKCFVKLRSWVLCLLVIFIEFIFYTTKKEQAAWTWLSKISDHVWQKISSKKRSTKSKLWKKTKLTRLNSKNNKKKPKTTKEKFSCCFSSHDIARRHREVFPQHRDSFSAPRTAVVPSRWFFVAFSSSVPSVWPALFARSTTFVATCSVLVSCARFVASNFARGSARMLFSIALAPASASCRRVLARRPSIVAVGSNNFANLSHGAFACVVLFFFNLRFHVSFSFWFDGSSCPLSALFEVYSCLEWHVSVGHERQGDQRKTPQAYASSVSSERKSRSSHAWRRFFFHISLRRSLTAHINWTKSEKWPKRCQRTQRDPDQHHTWRHVNHHCGKAHEYGWKKNKKTREVPSVRRSLVTSRRKFCSSPWLWTLSWRSSCRLCFSFSNSIDTLYCFCSMFSSSLAPIADFETTIFWARWSS